MERFRELFAQEYVAFRRPAPRDNYAFAFDGFEKACALEGLRAVTERTVAAFAARRHKDGLARPRSGCG